QQEPRMAVHYACLARELIGEHAWRSALAARDAYRNDPNTDNHQMMADMAGISRKAAKEIYLGLSYGMGGAKMCRKLGLPTMMAVRGPRGVLYDATSPEGQRLAAEGARRFEAAGPEGQQLLDTFDAKVPFVKRLAKACEQRAKAVGYITTLSGRRCRFPKDPHGNFDWTHKGLNRLIQGSSADQTKMAMVACAEAGLDIIIQVHDEIAFSVKNRDEAEHAAEIMRNCTPLELPSKVDVEIGQSWGHSMGWDGNPPS
ncbi:MAG: DNA polymerase, partial [Methanomethylophilus sp.]